MKEFPREGKFRISYNEFQRDQLEEFLIKRCGKTDSKMSKYGAFGIGWNERSYWWIKEFNNSRKPEYNWVELEPFINNKTMDKDELLKIAKEKYPVGTKFKNPIERYNDVIHEVLNDDFRFLNDGINIKATNGLYNRACVYDGDKWGEIISLPNPKTKYEVNKWYKLTSGANKLVRPWFIKYKGYTDSVHRSTEYLDGYKKYKRLDNANFGEDGAYTFTLLTDLTEIQQYLPDGHPDKINTIPEYVECIKGIGDANVRGIFKTKTKAFDDRIWWLYTKENSNLKYIETNGGWDTVGPLDNLLKYFKPSTKEAYEAQSKPKEWIPKVGDWVVSLINVEPYRIKGQVFKVLKLGSSINFIYYEEHTNGNINTFRPAEPHEIPTQYTTQLTSKKYESLVKEMMPQLEEFLKATGCIEWKTYEFEPLTPSFTRSPKTIPIYVEPITTPVLEPITPILLKKINKTKI
jgi:hypothetical protein